VIAAKASNHRFELRFDFLHASSFSNWPMFDASRITVFGLSDSYDWGIHFNNELTALTFSFSDQSRNVAAPNILTLPLAGILFIFRTRSKVTN
jgi:hypothetical protein